MPTDERRDLRQPRADDNSTPDAGLAIRRLWLPLLAGIPVCTFLLLGFFTGPSADDFCMADATVKLGFLRALRDFYQIMSGRYASMGIELLPGYLDHSSFLVWYWVVPTTVILATLFSTYILLNTLNTFVLAETCGRSGVLAVSIVLTSMYLVGLEQPSQVIYWLTGAVNYQLANVLFALMLAVLIRCYAARTRVEKAFWFATSVALVVLIVGHNETTMVLTLGVLALIALFAVRQALKDRAGSRAAMMMCLLAAAVISALVVALAPGNASRAQYEEQTWGLHKADSLMELVGAGLSSVIWAATNILRWANSLSYWLAAFLALGASRRLPAPVQERLENRSLLWLPAIGFAMIAATALPSFYVGRPPATRTTASIYIVFWLSFVTSAVILMRRCGWELYGSGVTTGLKVALVLSVLFSPRHIQATDDFRDAVLYKLQLDERDMMVTDAVRDGRKNVVVPRLTRLPATIHFRDLSEDGNYYYNQCYASYRNIDSIVAKGEGDTAQLPRRFREKVRFQIERFVPWMR
jgi:Family of unknown function (DUF6056)